MIVYSVQFYTIANTIDVSEELLIFNQIKKKNYSNIDVKHINKIFFCKLNVVVQILDRSDVLVTDLNNYRWQWRL